MLTYTPEPLRHVLAAAWSFGAHHLGFLPPPPQHHPPAQDLKCDSEDERAAYEELQAQLLAAHPAHLPLLLERLQRAQRAAGAAKGDAAAQKVCSAPCCVSSAAARVGIIWRCARSSWCHSPTVLQHTHTCCCCLTASHLLLLPNHCCYLPPSRPPFCRQWLPPQTLWWQPSMPTRWQSTWRKSAPRRALAPTSARRVRGYW